MTILCDRDLIDMLDFGLIVDADRAMLNPASVDVRIGGKVIREESFGRMAHFDIPDDGLVVEPGDFLLTETLEYFNVPNGYAVELRLKSTAARMGWNHAMAVWIDPGFRGVITLEIKNDLQYNTLRLRKGQRFAQAIVHRLSGTSGSPYNGRYQGAVGVEGAKDGV
jgi:dCTP deaminase